LAAYGFAKGLGFQIHPTMSANDAVSALRSLRPGSIETAQQEAFVSKWCSTIWKRSAIVPDLPAEPPPCDLVIEEEEKQGGRAVSGDLYMLVGLPGSGKSWFSKALLARHPNGWTHICQDESGSRELCEVEIGRADGRVLLDRCNASAADRKIWLGLASNWVTSPICVWFDYSQELCTSRAQTRADHPTLPPGNRVRNAVDNMRRVFVRPSLSEGFKAVVIIRSFAAARDLVLRLSPAVTLFKFPRTPHIIDLGAATSDDVFTDAARPLVKGHVILTEKVDGSNMGFSLSSDRSQIIIQNRSHYINPLTHEQFKKLGYWVDRHRRDLLKILGRDEHFPERYILFGEWLFATHSIPYTHLRDLFLAYDLYDRSTAQWADRKSLSGLLAPTTLHMVPIIHEGDMPSSEELKNMVQRQSKFWDGRIEGVYVKVENYGRVVERGKVVRADFIAGNEHWTKGGLRVNGLQCHDP
jgi:atypical dual specificity phosphatase